MTFKLNQIVAAVHTPFHADGSLNLAIVEKQAAHLLKDNVRAAFIGGTTGESTSLTIDERLALAKQWMEVTRGGSEMKVIVHVGSNCLADARALAAQAQELNATAIAALAPSYFKPQTLDDLIACCADVAAAAPGLPFYYYDIPSLTGVSMSMPEFLESAGERIPTLAGIKFTNPDLMSFQQCLRARDGAFDIPWGADEYLLAALALGASAAVGSTYNFAAPMYHRMWKAFKENDLAMARDQQYRAVRLVKCLASFGYMAAAKALMTLINVDVGPPRLPHARLSADALIRLEKELAGSRPPCFGG